MQRFHISRISFNIELDGSQSKHWMIWQELLLTAFVKPKPEIFTYAEVYLCQSLIQLFLEMIFATFVS